MDGVKVKQSRKEIEWRQRLVRFAVSGQQINTFCQGEAVSEASFHRWRKLLRDTPAMPVSAVFLDAGLMATPSAAARQMAHDAPGSSTALEVRLELGGGLVLHIVRR